MRAEPHAILRRRLDMRQPIVAALPAEAGEQDLLDVAAQAGEQLARLDEPELDELAAPTRAPAEREVARARMLLARDEPFAQEQVGQPVVRERRARGHRHAGVEVERLVAVAARQRHRAGEARRVQRWRTAWPRRWSPRSPSSFGRRRRRPRLGCQLVRQPLAGAVAVGAAWGARCAAASAADRTQRRSRSAPMPGNGVDAERVEIDVAERVLVLVARRARRRRRIGEQPPLGRRQLALQAPGERRALVEARCARAPPPAPWPLRAAPPARRS